MTKALSITKARELANTLLSKIDTEALTKVEAIGHTEYQIRKFILNDAEFPTPDSKYRQIIRELLTRWGGIKGAEYTYDKSVARVMLLEAERDELKQKRTFGSIARRKKEAQLLDLELDIQNEYDKQKGLIMELDHKLMRESLVLLDELSRYEPEVNNRMAAEERNWTEKAKYNPRLAEIMKTVPRVTAKEAAGLLGRKEDG